MPESVVQSFFEGPVNSAINHVRNLLAKPELHDLKHIFLVGGFAESPYLQEKVKAAFEPRGIKVVVPARPSLAVIIGAVQYGMTPNVIQSRASARTYGVPCLGVFEEGLHDPTRGEMKELDGIKHIMLFDTFVKINEPVEYNKKVSRKRLQSVATAERVEFSIYSSLIPDNTYVTTEMNKVGIAILPTTGKGKDLLTIELLFGGTEIVATARNEVTNQDVIVTIDFLSIPNYSK